MNSDEKKSLAEELLRQKQAELGRTPLKDDFDEKTRSRIKAFLGPWPRALEAAGLKEKRTDTKKNLKRSRRAKASKVAKDSKVSKEPKRSKKSEAQKEPKQ